MITGLGNIGSEYWGTRHNIGFRVVNHMVESVGGNFTEERYGAIARIRVKNCDLIVLKPNTFMNLSGNAVRYWLQKENIPVENLLIVVDDLALPFGTLRPAKVMLGMRLCVLHNLYFYNTMMSEIRQAIEEGNYKEYKKRKIDGMMNQ